MVVKYKTYSMIGEKPTQRQVAAGEGFTTLNVGEEPAEPALNALLLQRYSLIKHLQQAGLIPRWPPQHPHEGLGYGARRTRPLNGCE